MSKMTPDQSHYVLQTLVGNGTVRASQIDKALRGREQEIRSLRERLAALERLSGGTTDAAGRRGRGRPSGSSSSGARGARPARRAMSPKTLALRKLQGKYMGYVRGLKPAEKARVRKVREKQGMKAAIALASSLGGRK
jgi:hypothetical protein